MGQLIMVGTLCGLIGLVVAVVLRYDPEARRSPTDEAGEAGG